MPATKPLDEDIDLAPLDRKDPRPFEERVVPEIVHPPKHDVDRSELVDPNAAADDSNDSDETVTDTDDQFDWDAEDDAKSQHVAASIKAKRGRLVYRAFLKLPKILRVLLIGAIGAGILITPLLVTRLRFRTSVVQKHAYVWSLWLTISWAAGIITYIVVDLIPHFVLVILRITSYKVERLRVTVEVGTVREASPRGGLTLCFPAAHSRHPRLDQARARHGAHVGRALGRALDAQPPRDVLGHRQPRHAGTSARPPSSPPSARATQPRPARQALFTASVLVLAEKIFLRYVAINFHRKALADRLTENKLGLRALDRLSNAQPAPKRAPYAGRKGHRSRGPSLDMLGMAAPGHEKHASAGGGSGGSGGGSSGASSPTAGKKEARKQAKKQRKNVIAAVIVDQLGGALEQVTQDQYGSLASAGKLARKLFSALSDVHPPRNHLVVEGERRARPLSRLHGLC